MPLLFNLMKNTFLYGSSGYFREQYVWLKDCLIEKKDYQVVGIIDDLSKTSTDNFSSLKIFKSEKIQNCTKLQSGAKIFLHLVSNPFQYGVVKINSNNI